MKIGDIMQDNDPRSACRLLVIVAMERPHYVRAKRLVNGVATPRRGVGRRIKRSRIHPVGSRRGSGYTIVAGGAA